MHEWIRPIDYAVVVDFSQNTSVVNVKGSMINSRVVHARRSSELNIQLTMKRDWYIYILSLEMV